MHKILLLGEFSGVHLNLKKGLMRLGCDVKTAGFSDGYKKIPIDLDFGLGGNRFERGIRSRVLPYLHLSDLSGFDVVQLMNPFIFSNRFFPALDFYRRIKDRNGVFSMLAAGSDYFYWKESRRQLKYGPFEQTLMYDLKRNVSPYLSRRSEFVNMKVVELADVIIPMMYDYQVGYLWSEKLKPAIHFPLDLNGLTAADPSSKHRIKIFHGLSRYGFKGTRFVESAFRQLSNELSAVADFEIAGNMPISQYLEKIKESDIVVDQLNSHGWGMNALYAAAMKKVVITGAEPEAIDALGIARDEVHFVNCTPSAERLVGILMSLVGSDLEAAGANHRTFVENYSDPVTIATQFLDAWGS